MTIGIWMTANNGHGTGEVHFSDWGNIGILATTVHQREGTNVAQTSLVCLA